MRASLCKWAGIPVLCLLFMAVMALITGNTHFPFSDRNNLRIYQLHS